MKGGGGGHNDTFDLGQGRDNNEEEANRFWDEEFAVVMPPRSIASDLELLTVSIPDGDPRLSDVQSDLSIELNETLSSLSLSLSLSSSSSSSSNLLSPGLSPISPFNNKGGDTSTVFTPYFTEQRPAIVPLTVYSDSFSSSSSPSPLDGLRDTPLRNVSPSSAAMRRRRLSPSSLERQQQQQQEVQDGELVVQTPLGPRRVVTARPRALLLVDSSNRTLQLLRESEVFTFGVDAVGATRVMGGDAPTIAQTREGYTVTFSSVVVPPTRPKRSEERKFAMAMPVAGQAGARMPFKVWTDVEERDVQPVPLGAFQVATAYFTGTYKGDLVGKRECGMMYSSEEAAVTVIQSNHPDFSQQKNHFVIGMRVDNNRQTLFQVAIHKRLWAHSWARGKEDVYFPRVPVLTASSPDSQDQVPTSIGIRIWASVFSDKKGSRDPVTKRALAATVVVTRIAFELPLSVSQFLVSSDARTRRRAIFNDDDDE